jgi:6-pyruvoyltetrahydropterin/6-carboxytetrahydropterin synthase
MYHLAVEREFVAQHFLIGGDWGAEHQWHSHHYRLELQLAGPKLNQHGYLVDIVDVEATLNAIVQYYRDRTLNDLPEFADLNPSIEHFCRIVAEQLAERLGVDTIQNLSSLTVKIWENEIAWAAYQQQITSG